MRALLRGRRRLALVTLSWAALSCAAPDRKAPVVELPVASGAARGAPPPGETAPPSPARGAPAGEPDACAADEDCTLTTFPGCCACCDCSPLRAVRKDVDAKDRARCAIVDCSPCMKGSETCAACQDPQREGMRARCLDRQCTLVETRARR